MIRQVTATLIAATPALFFCSGQAVNKAVLFARRADRHSSLKRAPQTLIWPHRHMIHANHTELASQARSVSFFDTIFSVRRPRLAMSLRPLLVELPAERKLADRGHEPPYTSSTKVSTRNGQHS